MCVCYTMTEDHEAAKAGEIGMEVPFEEAMLERGATTLEMLRDGEVVVEIVPLDKIRKSTIVESNTFAALMRDFYAAHTLEDTSERMAADELKLRKLLWLRHGCDIAALYGDDGEMQCGKCRIDFKRATPDEIAAVFHRAAMKEFVAVVPLEETPVPKPTMRPAVKSGNGITLLRMDVEDCPKKKDAKDGEDCCCYELSDVPKGDFAGTRRMCKFHKISEDQSRGGKCLSACYYPVKVS